MDFEAFLLFIFCVSCEAFGQLCFKAASQYSAQNKLEGQKPFLKRHLAYLNIYFFTAITLFCLEWICWIVFLSLTPLSVAALLSSASIFVVIISSSFFYHEKLTPAKILASLFIFIGIAFISWS